MKDKEIVQEEDEFVATDESGDELTLEDKIKALRKKLFDKEKEAQENLTGWQRARAELVNKEKQLQSEKLEIYKNAAASILEEIIPALDSYEMARKNISAWESVEKNWRMGIEYIFQQLQTVVENFGLKKIEPKIGDGFDVKKMHAIEEVATDDENMDQKVSEVIQSGYELNGKMLREAKVKIYIKK